MALLEQITGPQDLKKLSIPELESLALELREVIIDTVNRNGGHLASPLGVVELTIALHHVFDIGKDQLIWDVGHQCYAHKLLTGRRDRFDSLRKRGGISGYPKISESELDCFGTGHSSTSISAALGMAIARDQLNHHYHVIALIGDGAMTGGMAMEALSHAGHLGLNLLVILNDNEMCIARNTGALARYFNRLIMAGPYKRAKEDVGSFVKGMLGGRMTRTIQDLERSLKGFITKGALFQELGFNYIGPVDGHDLPLLIECLNAIKTMHGPILFHCRTEKGKGLKEAEEDPQKYHGIKPMTVKKIDCEGDALPAQFPPATLHIKTFTDVFAEALVEAARDNPRVVGITAAMPTGTGLSLLEKEFPERFFDVGICEQHAVTLAAGMARQGMRPVAAIYSTFLQRGYDQVIHDVCLQNLPVVFAIDRAGLVGEDSPTQNGTFDLSFLRAAPNLRILAPRDDVDTRLMLHWALRQNFPVAIRYARCSAPAIDAGGERNLPGGELLRNGANATYLALGPIAGTCLRAAELLEQEGISMGVADARCAKPLDHALLEQLVDRPIITVEENTLEGGFGSAVLEHFASRQQFNQLRLLRLGIPDAFCEQATRDEQLAMHGLDAAGLAHAARTFLTP
ncbi:MAG TPA: 1-deoxy-D-xylulose-5-phosphate synthase [Candidatus Hydrogenedentes bacterium]|mgnify:CR=1 FL=1|nr:1-deoxy-D-xylulose-5-phosphate synthase [Candidatus Hydrogenedentota bacterium]